MKLSEKVSSMEFSPIRKFNAAASAAEERGTKIYRLNIGQPDIKTPKCFREAIDNYNPEVIEYQESQGTSELIDAIVNYYNKSGISVSHEDIMVANGGSDALNIVFISILDEGDEVLLPEPFYANYSTFITVSGGKVKPIPTKAEEGYHYADRELIESCITPKTKAILCTNPGNPTGTILTPEEMKLMCDIAIENDLWLISDEVYREFVYDGRKAYSFCNFSEVDDRLIVIDSASKRYSACGARIGCVVSKNRELNESVLKLSQSRLSVSVYDQIGAAALFNMDTAYYAEAREEYEARRDAAYEEMCKIPGIVCKKPGGSFYMMAKLPVDDIEDFLLFLLNEFDDNGETVMFSPANGFYANPEYGKDELRIAYVLSPEKMRRGVELLRLGLEAYLKK